MITVTGATGFVGTRFIRACNETDATVQMARVRSDGGRRSSLPPGDVLVHLAAIAHSNHPNEELVFEVNRDLSIATAEKARDAGYRQFIFLSSALVWGSGYEAVDRTTPERPDTAYGRAKLEAEDHLRTIETSDFAVTILRPPLVYGPGVKGNILKLVAAVHRWPVCPLGVANNRRSILHADNLGAFILHLAKEKMSGTFFPTDVRSRSTLEILQCIAHHLPDHGKVVEMPRTARAAIARFAPGTARRLFGSFVVHDDAITPTGFVPPFDIEDGFRKMVEGYLYPRKNFHEHNR